MEVKLDGTPLKKGEETKLGVGMTISYGSTEYKASLFCLTAAHCSASRACCMHSHSAHFWAVHLPIQLH